MDTGKAAEHGSFFRWVGRFAGRYRYAIIAIWLALLGLILVSAPKLSEVSTSDSTNILPKDASSMVALAKAQELFPDDTAPSQVVLVFQSTNGSFESREIQDYLVELTAWIKTELNPEVVNQVLSPVEAGQKDSLISPDGNVAMMYIGLLQLSDDPRVTQILDDIRTRLKSIPAGYTAYVTGNAAIIGDYMTQALDSVDRTTIITIVLVICILLLIYRSPVTPIVPLATIGLSYLITCGVVAWLTDYGLTVVTFTQAFLVVILFGVGTDYCLFIISRFREFIAEQMPSSEVAPAAMGRIGETITSSAGTVVVGMAAQSFAAMKLFSSTGPALAIGVVITLLASLTFTPALLAMLGPKAFWLFKKNRRSDINPVWEKIARWVATKPKQPLILSMIFLIPLAVFGLGLHQSFDMTSDLKDELPAKKGFMILSDHFGAGQMSPLDIVVTDISEARQAAGMAIIHDLTDELLALEGVADVRSLTLPAGKDQPEIGDFFRVHNQLAILANGLEAFTSAETSSLEVPAEFQQMTVLDLEALSSYLDEVSRAFPEVPAEQFFEVQRDLDGLKDTLTTGTLPIFVGQQLQAASQAISMVRADLPGLLTAGTQEATTAADPFPVLMQYFSDMLEAYPAMTESDGYTQTSAALAKLQLLSLAQTWTGGSVSFTAEQLLVLDGYLAELEGGLGRLALSMKRQVPYSIYIPQTRPAIFSQYLALDQIDLPLEPFIEGMRSLGEAFVQVEKDFFIPLNLVSGPSRTQMENMMSMYTSEKGDGVRWQVVLRYEPYSYGAMATVERIKTHLGNRYAGSVSGVSAISLDLKHYLRQDTVRTMALVMVGILIVLFFLLRSLISPIYLLSTILLSYLATLGIVRLVFTTLLHTDITWWVPFFMFVLLVALGVDYNIFLMGRVKEETARADTKSGIRHALQHTGSIITSAGIILAGTFASLISSSIVGLVQIGFAVTVGVLLDTFVIRTTLVPAIATLLDRWNWWPRQPPH